MFGKFSEIERDSKKVIHSFSPLFQSSLRIDQDPTYTKQKENEIIGE